MAAIYAGQRLAYSNYINYTYSWVYVLEVIDDLDGPAGKEGWFVARFEDGTEERVPFWTVLNFDDLPATEPDPNCTYNFAASIAG